MAFTVARVCVCRVWLGLGFGAYVPTCVCCLCAVYDVCGVCISWCVHVHRSIGASLYYMVNRVVDGMRCAGLSLFDWFGANSHTYTRAQPLGDYDVNSP